MTEQAAISDGADEPTQWTVDANESGKRVDRFLVDRVDGLSRARAKRMLDDGDVRVNGRRPRKGDVVREGDTVAMLAPPPPADFSPRANSTMALHVRYEDAALAVIDKPAGIPSHPLREDETETLASAIVAKYPETARVGYARREPGLVHRLDTDTSGLLVVARTVQAFDQLRDASKADRIVKHYIALVEGDVEGDGMVDYPLVPHRKDPRRVECVTPHVRLRAGTRMHAAMTKYHPVAKFRIDEPALAERVGPSLTLVEVELTRGFRHQIRAHLACIGHALVGDTLYRARSGEALGIARHFLHASMVEFSHPVDGRLVRVESELPSDLRAAIDQLRAFESRK